MPDVQMPLFIDDITIPDRKRKLDMAQVKKLAKSIDEIGLRHPISVRRWGEKYILVAGWHRLEACRHLGREHVYANILAITKEDARLWEIAENLHRSDLTKLERDEHVAEWVRLTEDKLSGQLAQKLTGGRPEGGVSAASRELGIERTEVRRAVKVDGLSDEAKKAAKETGLDDNRSALLEAAARPVSEQVATIHRLHTAKATRTIEAAEPLSDADSIEKQTAALVSAWNKACPQARQEFLLRVEPPVMDRRFK